MPKLVSRFFDSAEYSPDCVFHFPAGLPGFEMEKNFVGLTPPKQNPLAYLQSLQTPEFCLLTLPVRTIEADYSLQLSPEDLRLIGFPPAVQPRIGEDLLCLGLISLGEGEAPSVNLLAPLVINIQNRLGVQAIQPYGTYSHRHPVPVGKEAAC